MLTTKEFLRVVLPDVGQYSAAYKLPSGAFVHVYLDTTDELAECFEKYDGKANVYFTTASIKPGSVTATKQDVLFKRAFYIDLDAGPDKPFATVAQAQGALDTFRRSFNPALIEPVTVYSGNGLQAYWPLTDNVASISWEAVARGLKHRAQEMGLKCDDQCTADAARVLRAPDTINLKGGNRAKIVTDGDGARPLSYYTELFGTEAVATSKTRLFPGVYIPHRMLVVDETTKMLSGYTGVKKFIKLYSAGGCGLVKDFVESKVSTASEPEWRAMLSIANVCEDRIKAIQIVSDGHPGYVFEEAMRKAEATSGAYSCQSLAGIFGDAHCKECPSRERIQNPISLAIANDIVITGEATSISEELGIPGPAVTSQITLPYGHFIRGGHIFCRMPPMKDDDAPQEILVYPALFYATNRYLDPMEGESLSFRLHRPLEGVDNFIIPMKALVKKDTMQAALASYGVLAFDAGHLTALHRYVGAFAQKLQVESKAVQMHSRCGWTEDNTEFIIGDRIYASTGITSFPPNNSLRQLATKMDTSGSYEAWKTVLGLYDDPNLKAHRFALCAAAGAPILKFVGECGAVINFYSKGSGTGKTTLLRVINSMFGHPKDLMLAQNDTYAAKINRIGTMGNLPVTVDEVTTMSPEEASKFLYSITDGRERNRLSSKVNQERTNNSQWVTQVFTSSNAEISGKLELNAHSPEGEMARVIDVFASLPEGTNPQAVDAVLANIRSNYGWYGHYVATYLTANKVAVLQEITEFRSVVTESFKPRPNERFYFNTLISAYMGSVLLERLVGWSADRKELVLWFKDILNEIRDNNHRRSESVGNAFNEFLNENRDRILVVNSTADSRKKSATGMPEFSTQDRAIRDARQKAVARWEPDTRCLWLVKSEFYRWANERRVNTRELMREMNAKFPDSFMIERKRISKGTSLDLGVVESILINNADTTLEFDIGGEDHSK